MSPASKITFCCFLVILLCLRLVRDSSRTSVLANVSTANFRRSLLRQVLTEEHHFVPAFDQGIRYVGRWLHLPNQLRWDTAFPGAYIEFVVRNASIIFVSLHDARSVATKEEGLLQETKLRRINFKPSNDRNYAAPPLTVQVCDGNILMYSSSEQSLLSIHVNVSTHDKGCLLRVSHAGGTSGGDVLQFEGLWLPNGASLLPRLQPHEDTASIVQATRDLKQTSESSRQILEVFTDSATCASDHSSQFIVEWLSQLTVTFDIDYVQIPTYGHCLSEACLRTKPDGVSIQDIFFRSGPPKSTLFATPWNFHNYIPDVLILNLGTMDQQFLQSSTAHSENHVYFDDTRESLEGLTNSIVETYVDLIRRIRQTAYPLHPSALEKIDGDGYIYSSAPSTLPIFVVRPFDDSLEQVTLTVVERLQKDGDKAVFWIDTSGWVSEADYGTGGEDRNARCLTAAGHAKVASFMRAHLCHYLSPNSQECPFLRRDNYLGSVYVPIDAELDKIIEESKVQKLIELFWQYA